MRVLVYLSNPVRAFEATEAQLAALSAQLTDHEVIAVHDDAEFLAALELADVAVVWRFPEQWYPLATRLRHLFTPSAGREPFAPDPSGRVQLHFGHFHGAIMAESLLAMITFNSRRLGAALVAGAERRWDRAPYSECRRLRGQVVLLIGFGAIGRQCAALLSAVGMVVHGLRRELTGPSPPARRLFTREQRFEALALADHVVCILPGDTATDRFIDAAELAAMKPNACVYNLGRGNAIDADALRSALVAGRISAAFLDVVPEEPLPASSPLWSTPNLYLTPHASAISAEYLDLYFEELAGELSRAR
jgi:phosphoglycerate dehydrogenase-like enzyme